MRIGTSECGGFLFQTLIRVFSNSYDYCSMSPSLPLVSSRFCCIVTDFAFWFARLRTWAQSCDVSPASNGIDFGVCGYLGFGTLETTGTHCMVELYGCPPELLNDENAIKLALREAVDEGFADLLDEVSHQFTPQGVTALGLLSESHISIHTWPEHGYAAADVFTCGQRAKAEKACRYLVDALQADRHEFIKLIRGTGGRNLLASGCLTDATQEPAGNLA